MSVTVSELDSRTISGLGETSAEWLSLEDVHNAVVQCLAVRTGLTRISDGNALLSKSAEFTPAALITDITALVGKGTPAFVEYKAGDNFERIRIVNVREMDDFTATLVCAFYAEEAQTTGGAAKQFLRFSLLPSAVCRIRFDSDRVQIAMLDQSALPDNLAELIVLEAQNRLIPRIRNRIALDLNRTEADRKDVQLILGTLDSIYLQNREDIKPLNRLWEVWAFRDRAAQSPSSRRIPSGRRMYGG